MLDDVKAAVESSLSEDFEVAFAKFKASHPGDMMEFLLFLVEGDQLTDKALEVISRALPELEESGTLAPRDNGKPAATPAPPPMPAALRRKATLSGDKAPSDDDDEDDDDEPPALGPDGLPMDSKGRTMMLRAPRRKSRDGAETVSRRPERTGAPRERSKPPPASATGKTQRGYEFVGSVGEGAMGQVRLAKDLDLQRQVAYKVMSPEIQRNRVLAKKFYAEAQITAQLDHPNIVPIYALEEDTDGALAYSMKLIRGKTMEKIIEECWVFYDGRKKTDEAHSLETRLDQFLRVCDAVHFAHSRGVIHRDLKPENIMVGPYGEVYVMDWGIAKVMEPPSKKTPTAWIDLEEKPDAEGEVIIGTPQYMSPEQADGRTSELSGASDKYSLGLILYELVSLQQAVTGKSPMAIVTRQQDGDKNPLRHYGNEKIPGELRAIIDRATQFKPEKRYPSVHELAEDVKRYVRGDAVLARPDNPLQRLLRWMGRHRELTLLGIVFLTFMFMILTAGSQIFYQWQRLRSAAREEALTELLSTVGTQAALIDGQFVRYEGLLGVQAAAATEMLTRRPEEAPEIYTSSDFDKAKVGDSTETALPPKLVKSTHYGMPVSIEHPVYLVADGVDMPVAQDAIHRLAPIRRYLRTVVLRSHSEEAASYTPRRAERLITETGVPIVWTHIGLESGAYASYPGRAGLRQTDVRKAPWYELAAKGSDSKPTRGPRWGSPYIDPSGLGLILPGGNALFDEHDNFLGVAAIELTFDYIIEKLLELPSLRDQSDSFLVDDKGRVVIDSTKKGKEYRGGLTARAIRLPDFPNTEVREAISDRRSGYVEIHQDGRWQIVIYQRMSLLGWYYVVQGDSDALLR